MRELKRDLVEQSAKKSGRGGQFKAFERIIKNVPKNRTRSLGGVIQTNSARAVCDGFRAVRIFKSDVIMPDKIINEQDAMDIDSVFKVIDGVSPVDLPSVGELRGLIKTATAEYTGKNRKNLRPLFKLTGDTGVAVYVDARYLLDILEALPGASCKIGKNAMSAVYFTADDGDGVLMPIRYAVPVADLPVINEQKI